MPASLLLSWLLCGWGVTRLGPWERQPQTHDWSVMLVRGTVLSIFLCASTAKRPVAPPHALERLQKCEASRCSELVVARQRL